MIQIHLHTPPFLQEHTILGVYTIQGNDHLEAEAFCDNSNAGGGAQENRRMDLSTLTELIVSPCFSCMNQSDLLSL